MSSVSRYYVAWIVSSLITVARAETPTAKDTAMAISLQPLASALEVWAEQTGWQLLYDSEIVADRKISGAPESLPPIETLTKILDGTGLGYQLINERTVSIFEKFPAVAYPISMMKTAGKDINQAEFRKVNLQSEKRSADQGSSRSDTPKNESAQPTRANALTEVIVTAQKREQYLQEVPVPVTAINADALVESNQTQLADYYATVPGLNLSPGRSSIGSIINIRGIAGGRGPTVGVTLDDVPYAGTSDVNVPEIDPNDLERIEVLRGPQGTLYGASSMGGLIKYVTRNPSPTALSGKLRFGTSGITGADDLGYEARGSINVPLGETFAIRASGFTRRQPGFIDDPAHDLKDTNEIAAEGAGLTVLWRPSEAVSVKLNAIYDDYDLRGGNVIDPALGELTAPATYLPGMPTITRTNYFYGATINGQWGRVELTSLTGYSDYEFHLKRDVSAFFDCCAADVISYVGVPGLYDDNHTTYSKFSQELRASLPLGSRITWRTGVFYQEERNSGQGSTVASNDTGTVVVIGDTVTFPDGPSINEEHAIFTGLTFQLTERFDVEIGGRQSHMDQHNARLVDVGPLTPFFYGTPPGQVVEVIPETRSESDPFTYLFTPRFKISPDLMMYGRLASGYRRGGSNDINLLCPASECPAQFKSDQTLSYELGLKGNFFDRRLAVDTSLYYIDWTDLQTDVLAASGLTSYGTNAGAAVSKGFELSLQWTPLRGMTIAATGAWNDAFISEYPADATVAIPVGSQVPFTSRFNGSLSIDQEITLSGSLSASIGGAVTRFGEYPGPLGDPFPRAGYMKVDLRAGLNYETWNADLYVNNLTDEMAKLDRAFPQTTAFFYNQPRTVGLSISKSF
jgi:outer membrane receptor protein involved in Fe transport